MLMLPIALGIFLGPSDPSLHTRCESGEASLSVCPLFFVETPFTAGTVIYTAGKAWEMGNFHFMQQRWHVGHSGGADLSGVTAAGLQGSGLGPCSTMAFVGYFESAI